ncbi:MAG: nucleotidyltransferase [Elusimicrobia bacterium RIFOXYA2_FULL_50_26]|nr:MAG: nucleotidyltransferase [Elusimicrobia bacterium RIFOXYA2_FULL_50_26]OGS23776.1 MAG: nucleotidyltransferase [Elusimicrobia bacterium RIFOXYB2_FULL_50_12]
MYTITDQMPKDKLAAFCRKKHIRKLSLFGSALNDELRSDSDIDLLVEFEEGYIPGLLELAGIEIELAETIGRKVDLRTPAELSRFFRNEVLAHARVEYAA